MGCVYFIEESPTSDIKIGYTDNIQKRVQSLQTGNSNTLKVRCIIPDVEMTFECYMHEVCAKYRKQGEWFDREALTFLLEKSSPWFRKNIVRYCAAPPLK